MSLTTHTSNNLEKLERAFRDLGDQLHHYAVPVDMRLIDWFLDIAEGKEKTDSATVRRLSTIIDAHISEYQMELLEDHDELSADWIMRNADEARKALETETDRLLYGISQKAPSVKKHPTRHKADRDER